MPGHTSMPSIHSRRTGWTETPAWPEDLAPAAHVSVGKGRAGTPQGPVPSSKGLRTLGSSQGPPSRAREHSIRRGSEPSEQVCPRFQGAWATWAHGWQRH